MQTNESQNPRQQEHELAEGQAALSAPAAEEDTAGYISLRLPAYPLPLPQPLPLPRSSVEIVPLGPPGGLQQAP